MSRCVWLLFHALSHRHVGTRGATHFVNMATQAQENNTCLTAVAKPTYSVQLQVHSASQPVRVDPKSKRCEGLHPAVATVVDDVILLTTGRNGKHARKGNEPSRHGGWLRAESHAHAACVIGGARRKVVNLEDELVDPTAWSDGKTDIVWHGKWGGVAAPAPHVVLVAVADAVAEAFPGFCLLRNAVTS